MIFSVSASGESILLITGIFYKQCILTVYENKLLHLGERHTWGLSRTSKKDMDAIKMGYIYPKWIDGIKSNFIILLVISIKFFYEKFIHK